MSETGTELVDGDDNEKAVVVGANRDGSARGGRVRAQIRTQTRDPVPSATSGRRGFFPNHRVRGQCLTFASPFADRFTRVVLTPPPPRSRFRIQRTRARSPPNTSRVKKRSRLRVIYLICSRRVFGFFSKNDDDFLPAYTYLFIYYAIYARSRRFLFRRSPGPRGSPPQSPASRSEFYITIIITVGYEYSYFNTPRNKNDFTAGND